MAEALSPAPGAGEGNSAEPSAGQAEGQVERVAQVGEPGSEAPEKKVVKPIPAKGMSARDKALQSIGVLGVDDEPLFPPKKGSAERGPDGKFVAKDRNDFERELEGDGDGGDATKPPLPPGAEKPAVQKIKLGDKEYESLEQANQAHKSLQGMFKGLNEKVTATAAERDYGYQAANAWRGEYKKQAEVNRQLQERIAALENGSARNITGLPKAGAGNGQGNNPSDVASPEEINFESFEALAVTRGLPHAAQWLYEQARKSVFNSQEFKDLLQRIEGVEKPIQTSQEYARQAQEVEQLVTELRGYRTHKGEQAFPELENPETVEAIGALWRDMGLPSKHLYTREGLQSAIGTYRMYQGFPTAESASQGNGQGNGAPRVPSPAPGPAASVSADEGVGRPHTEASNARNATERQIVKGMKNTQMVHPVLGFPIRSGKERD